MANPTPTTTWPELARTLDRIVRKITLAYRRLSWAVRNEPINDDERFAFRLAERHIKEGRFDLAEEDLEWLGRRIDDSEGRGFSLAG